MKKKITIKEIAKQANVSIATVSYVLNDTPNKRISEETRKKVLQIANLFGYTINMKAKSLVSGKFYNISLCFPSNNFAFAIADEYKTYKKISSYFIEKSYTVSLYDINNINKATNSDAIICFGLAKEKFSEIGEANYIPLVSVNTKLDDPIFFEIDFIIEHPKFTNQIMLCTNIESLSYKEEIESKFPVIYINDLSDLNKLNPSNNYITLSHSLYKYLKTKNIEIEYIEEYSYRRIETIFESVINSINSNSEVNHILKI